MAGARAEHISAFQSRTGIPNDGFSSWFQPKRRRARSVLSTSYWLLVTRCAYPLPLSALVDDYAVRRRARPEGRKNPTRCKSAASVVYTSTITSIRLTGLARGKEKKIDSPMRFLVIIIINPFSPLEALQPRTLPHPTPPSRHYRFRTRRDSETFSTQSTTPAYRTALLSVSRPIHTLQMNT